MQRTFYIHLRKAKPDLLTPFKVSLLIANHAFLFVMQLERDTVIYGTALTWTLVLPVWKTFTSTQNQMYGMRRIHPLQSCLKFLSVTENLFTSKLVFILQSFFFNHIWLNTLSKGTWKTCRHGVGAGQKNALAYQWQEKRINNIAEQIIVIYIREIDGERFHIFGKSSFFDHVGGQYNRIFLKEFTLKWSIFIV